ncbi:glycoside hydrolase [Tenacibaculum holothuriorum]|uniref:Glycoside hydrolase n=1 Tax=Tenacibaculum holothuriorum TaxID=1635173 RepID=A0A1Y2PBI9_9FLAO|nr:glycoside hydrolase [Tenacibaculum holothuriorum]OSY87157.1 glycoside hydrolase [Tenacibaculum holothuriorum]
MKIFKLLLLSLVCFSCSSQTQKINGVSFVASSEAINNKHIQPVKKVSANYVALMPFGFIRSISSPEVQYNAKRQWFGETNEGLKQYSSEFRKEKIKVMVKPQIWVWNGTYTGKIEMKSEEDWKQLETSYEKFIVSFAKTSEELKAEIFCIGTELEKFILHRPEYWKQLIGKIRKVYSGKLTYAANWDEFKRVPFWNLLDYIGVDAYFPLSTKQQPTLEEFEKGWLPHKTEIEKVQQQYQKPILFTEYGYRSVHFTGKEPWDSNRVEGQINHENQKNGLQALYNQFWKEDWFAGGFVWKWFHNYEKVGGMKNNRFTPQNKPAEETIKQNYGL